jgi:hypothetical protein
MSTSSQIQFKNKKGESILIYKHSDGDPERMVPEIREFLEWNKGRNNDLEYTAANYIFWGKTRDMDPKLGYGICTDKQLNPTVDYAYKVNIETKEIETFMTEQGSGPINIIWTKVKEWSDK